MTHGPVEVLVVSFPGNHFSGTVIPELAKVVESKTITIIDGLFVRRAPDGTIGYFEIDEITSADGEVSLAGVIDRVEGLISEDDVAELSAGLVADSSAAILVFEHTWFAPLHEAIRASGGVLLEDVHIDGSVADEVFDSISE